jgi:type IV secretion system protein VirD4
MMSANQRALVRLVTFFGGGLLGLAVATQRQAAMFHYPVEFGPGVDIGAVRLYPPWAFLHWMKLYAHLYPADFAGNLALLVICAVIPAMIGAATTGALNPNGPVRHYGQHAWAKMADLRRAKLVGDGVRLGRVFGKFHGKLLVFDGDDHSIVVGASRSGKGAGHVIPTLISWPKSVFCYDRKGELWHITADWRKKFSHVFRFEPTDPNTVRWNPLFEVRKGRMEVADIQNVVGILVDPLGLKLGNLDFWDKSATAFFTAVMLHVLYAEPDERKNLAHVRCLLINLDTTLWAMKNTLHRHRPDDDRPDGKARDEAGQLIPETHPQVLLGATALENLEAKVKSGVVATALASLELWADPMVEYATSWSDFLIGDLVCSQHPVSFYITTPQAHADRLAFLVRVFTRQTINSLMETQHHDSRGRRKRHRMLLLLDEFPKLGALPFLEGATGEMASYGITAHLICQSFNDVFSKYGDRTPLFDNMHITATFATSEPASIKKVIERAGKSLELRASYSNPRTLFSRTSRSVSYAEQQRYILSEEDVRGLDPRKQFLFVNNCKPILADKIRYWKAPFFAKRAGDYFHEKPAAYTQLRGKADLPGAAQIDWLGVRCVSAAPPMPARRRRPDASSDIEDIVDMVADEDELPVDTGEDQARPDLRGDGFDLDDDDEGDVAA